MFARQNPSQPLFFLISITPLEIILTGTVLTQQEGKDLNLSPTVQNGESWEKGKCEYIETEYFSGPIWPYIGYSLPGM